MALKKIGFKKFDREPVKLTALAVGDKVTGYFVGTMKSAHEGGADNMIFRDKDTGEQFIVYTAGNVKYDLKDQKFTIGWYTEITRIEDKMVKGKKFSQFTSAQDDEDTNPWEAGGAADVETHEQEKYLA